MTRLLITGGAGFVGHHVIDYFLKNTDYDIVSLDRLDFSGNLNRIQRVVDSTTQSRVRVVFHDLRAELNAYVRDQIGPIDYILHIAAASHVTRSIQFPLEFVTSNIIGTANLLEFARTLPDLKRYIQFSTDEVFGPAVDDQPFREYDRYNSCNPYSASKAGAEELCVAYQNTYGVPIYITHTMNIYGERQNPEKYIPMTIKKIMNKETIKIHYNSKNGYIGSRTYIHALDVANALDFLLKLNNPPKPENHRGGRCPKFNIASLDDLDNLTVARAVAEFAGRELDYELVDPNQERPGHDFRYAISGDYLRSLGWSPVIDFRQGLEKVVQYTIQDEYNG